MNNIMGNNLHNSYVFQAIDAYPYNLEETLEALNFALSYNEKDTQALCLMGRVYAEQLKDYELKQKTGANRAGLWIYESALKNLQRAKEIRWDTKSKQWIYVG